MEPDGTQTENTLRIAFNGPDEGMCSNHRESLAERLPEISRLTDSKSSKPRIPTHSSKFIQIH